MANDPPTPGRRKAFTFRRTFSFGTPPPDDGSPTVIPADVKSLKWEWPRPNADAAAPSEPADAAAPLEPSEPFVAEPATYYEALSGRPDPHRAFFVSARRTLNLVVTGIAIGIPVLLVGLGIATRADAQTIVVMGIGGAVVGLMLKSSFPKTPFD